MENSISLDVLIVEHDPNILDVLRHNLEGKVHKKEPLEDKIVGIVAFILTQREGKSGRSGRFVPCNCAAIPEKLFESEFFGHEIATFTGVNWYRSIRDNQDTGNVCGRSYHSC